MTSDAKLKRLYTRLNRKYFNGQLRDDVAVFWEPCQDNIAVTFEFDAPDPGHPDEYELGIRFDPQVAGLPSVIRARMLHEMCHVKTWDKRRRSEHGNGFWAEMDRLWQTGAFRQEECV